MIESTTCIIKYYVSLQYVWNVQISPSVLVTFEKAATCTVHIRRQNNGYTNNNNNKIQIAEKPVRFGKLIKIKLSEFRKESFL